MKIPDVIRQAVLDIGYDDARLGLDGASCGILVAIEEQSPDISQGVTEGEGLYKEQGAGDQGMMFGYACTETEELMPLPIMLAHKLVARQAECRMSGELEFLRPDAKSQVTVEYGGSGPLRLDAVVLSTQHDPDIAYEALKAKVVDAIVRPVLPEAPAGRRHAHLREPDRPLRGRRAAGRRGRDRPQDHRRHLRRHGPPRRRRVLGQGPVQGRPLGGVRLPLGGQEPGRRGRGATASRCRSATRSAWPSPSRCCVDTFGTGHVDDERIERAIRKRFDLTPRGIIDALDLLRPIYRQTAFHGHFGRTGDAFTWEKTSLADDLRRDLGL